MRKTSLEGFRAELLSTGGYRTHAASKTARRAKNGVFTTFHLAWPIGSLFLLTALHRAFGILNHDRWDRMCFKTVTAAESLGMNVVFEGWENRAAVRGPVVYVCNHLSSFETIMLPPVMLTYGPYIVAVKEALLKLPFMNKDLSDFMGMVPIGRRNPREDLINMLRIGTEKIRAGFSFLVFPQGARSKVFDRAQFSSLGAKVAERACCPICPIVVDTRCLPMRDAGPFRRVLRDFGSANASYDVRCACGPVIPCGKSREMNAAAFAWMAGKLAEWGLSVVGI